MKLVPSDQLWKQHVIVYENTVFIEEYEENVYGLWVQSTDRKWYRVIEIRYKSDGATNLFFKAGVSTCLLMSLMPEIEKRSWNTYIQ